MATFEENRNKSKKELVIKLFASSSLNEKSKGTTEISSPFMKTCFLGINPNRQYRIIKKESLSIFNFVIEIIEAKTKRVAITNP